MTVYRIDLGQLKSFLFLKEKMTEDVETKDCGVCLNPHWEDQLDQSGLCPTCSVDVIE